MQKRMGSRFFERHSVGSLYLRQRSLTVLAPIEMLGVRMSPPTSTPSCLGMIQSSIARRISGSSASAFIAAAPSTA